MIYLDKSQEEPLYMQIYEQIRTDILQRVLKEGDVLQGTRGLAMTLGVSRNTVDSAYSQLYTEGYIIPKTGVGYVVAKLPELNIETSFGTEKKKHGTDTKTAIAKPKEKQEVLYDLTNGSHTNDLFPKAMWKKSMLECLDILDSKQKLSSMIDKQGEEYLQTALRDYLTRIRGIRCDREQMVITCGIQQSLEIICKLLSNEGMTVLMEEPGYHKAAAVFRNNGLHVQTVPVDEQGLIISKLPAGVRNCVVYSTPSHQFPTGVTMPISRRLDFLNWARKNNAYIIEDDFDSELRYYAKPVPALQSIDEEGHVIYLGTFSKALSPNMRMGYMVLPNALLHTYLEKFEDYNSTVPVLNQYIVAHMIESGEYDRHVRRMNHVFRKRYECFEKLLSEISASIKVSGNGSGQYFLLQFPEGISQEILIKRALEQKVKVYSTMQFWQDKAACPPNTLFLGFSKIDMKDIPDCVARLKKAWSELLCLIS